MVAFLLLVIGSIGLGGLLKKIFNLKNPIYASLIGFYALPVLMFIGYFVCAFNLRAGFFFAAAISTLGLFFYRISDFKNLDRFPLIAFIVTGISFSIYARPDFIAIFGDEFSHWALYPKQILLQNTLISQNFLPGSNIHYMPGLAFLNTFGEALTGVWTSSWGLLLSQFASTLAFVGLIAFMISALFKDSEHRFIFSTLALAAFFMLFRSEIFPISNLIEVTQAHSICVFFALMCFFEIEEVSDKVRWASLALVLGYAYLIKTSNLNLLPVAIVYTYMRSHSKKEFLQRLLAVSSLVLAFYILWKVYLSTAASSGAIQLNSQGSLIEIIQRRSSVFSSFVTEFFNQKSSMMALGLSLIFSYFAGRRITILTYFFFVTYMLGLLFLYLFVFGEHEGLKLASYGRYILLPAAVLKLHAVIGLSMTLKKVKIPQFKYLNAVAALILAAAAGANADRRYNSDLESRMYNINRLIPYSKTYDALKASIEKHGLESPKLLFIEQGGVNYGSMYVNYLSVEQNRYLYRTSVDSSFNINGVDPWTHQMPEEEMLKYFLTHELIVVHQSDEWLNGFFKRHEDFFICDDLLAKPIFIKVNGKFICE